LVIGSSGWIGTSTAKQFSSKFSTRGTLYAGVRDVTAAPALALSDITGGGSARAIEVVEASMNDIESMRLALQGVSLYLFGM
jgi:uncharacterized protein YbjT (DUF2867 family)